MNISRESMSTLIPGKRTIDVNFHIEMPHSTRCYTEQAIRDKDVPKRILLFIHAMVSGEDKRN